MANDEDSKEIKDLSDIQNTDPAEEAGQPYDVPLDILLADEAHKMSPEEMKRLKKNLAVAGGILAFIVLFIIYAIQPAKGTIAFGLCSTFLELNTPYPHTLSYTGVIETRTATRIYYRQIDPFGQFREEMMECTYGPDEKMGMRLVKVTRNRQPMDKALIEKFNLTLPLIGASDPYLVLPPLWKNQLLEGVPMYEVQELPSFLPQK